MRAVTRFLQARKHRRFVARADIRLRAYPEAQAWLKRTARVFAIFSSLRDDNRPGEWLSEKGERKYLQLTIGLFFWTL